MTNLTMNALREVQQLDDRIRDLKKKIAAFDPQLAEVEEPALQAESEASQVRERLEQMRADARRLERAAEDKRARAAKMDERLSRVSNLREEAAVRTELDLIRRALEADDKEALHLMEQISRAEMALDELEKRAAETRAEVEPRQEELLAGRKELETELDGIGAKRDAALQAVGDRERRVYDAFQSSGRAVVVASLTPDGACGNCFGMIPLQLQNEIRQGGDLIRCENCGVIVTPEVEEEPRPVTGSADQAAGSGTEVAEVDDQLSEADEETPEPTEE
jgi:predicted  nucleic acid-binding Zn-ribbon protein